jgi:hypothetical protein
VTSFLSRYSTEKIREDVYPFRRSEGSGPFTPFALIIV